MKAVYLFSFLFFFLTTVSAHSWVRHQIPGAFCGNGDPYSVFVEIKDPTKLLVEFQGGGACWSELTCYGRVALVDLAAPTDFPKDNFLIRESSSSPWSQHSKIYFPYCTADVFSGHHEASYMPGVQLFHYGYWNVVSGLNFLSLHQIVPFAMVSDLVVWGASAGGIASLVHADNVQQMVPLAQRKTLISDSPGLHFGKNFWRKFSPRMQQDFVESFARMDLALDLNDGLVARQMGPVFAKLHNWKIGILQSTKDMAMSVIYGGLTPNQHRDLVLGPSGLPEVAKNYPQAAIWIADVSTHTFLIRNNSASTRSMQGETASDFAIRTYLQGR